MPSITNMLETRGKIAGISGRHLWLELDTTPILPIGDEVTVSIKKYHEKRSLSANAYFHVLVDKLRQVLKISFAECKNTLITSYGQIEYIDDAPVTIKINVPPEIMAQNEVLHCKPIPVEDADAYFYRVYRGSHTYDSYEMAMLIDGTVEECKAQGIETLTPNELARLEGYAKQSNR